MSGAGAWSGRGKAVAFAALTLALLGALLVVQAQFLAAPDADAVRFQAVFIDEDNHEFFNDTLVLPNATAFAALQAAADEGDFTYDVDYYPGFGSKEAGTYVVEINGTRAERGQPDGWIYRVHRDGEWVRPDRSAALWELEDDDVLAWAWTSAWNARMDR